MSVLSKRVPVGATAPDFSLPNSQGGYVTLSGLRKRGCVLLVFLRGFGCPFCRWHLRQLARQSQAFADAGVQVMVIAHDSPQKAKAYFDAHQIPFPCLIDSGHSVYDMYQVESRPESLGQRPAEFLVDRDGVVRYAHIGWQQWEIPGAREVLEICSACNCK